MKTISIVTPPALEPVTLAEAKAYLRVDGNEEDDLIQGLITTARELAEKNTRRAFIKTTLDVILDASPLGPYELPRPPLIRVVEVATTSDAGVETVVDPRVYLVAKGNTGGRLALANGAAWPTHRNFASFRIRLEAGYGTEAASVPRHVRQAILMTVASLYENRSDVVTGTIVAELPPGAIAMLKPERVLRI